MRAPGGDDIDPEVLISALSTGARVWDGQIPDPKAEPKQLQDPDAGEAPDGPAPRDD